MIHWKKILIGSILAVIICLIFLIGLNALGFRKVGFMVPITFFLVSLFAGYTTDGKYAKEGAITGLLIGLIGGSICAIIGHLAYFLDGINVPINAMIIIVMSNTIFTVIVSAFGGLIGIILRFTQVKNHIDST